MTKSSTRRSAVADAPRGPLGKRMPGVEVLRKPRRARLATRGAGLNDAEVFFANRWGPLEDPMSGRRFHVVWTRRGSAIYRGFNEVLEIIVRADEPLAAPAGGSVITVPNAFRSARTSK